MNIKNIQRVTHNISTEPIKPKIPVPLSPVMIKAKSHSLLNNARTVIAKSIHGWLKAKEKINTEANPPIHRTIL